MPAEKPKTVKACRSENEPRLAVLETKMEHLEAVTARQEVKIDKISEDTTTVKEHLAKQNGVIPHMHEKLDGLTQSLGTLSTDWKTQQDKRQAEAVIEARRNTKTKIYLTVLGFFGASVAGLLVKMYGPTVIKWFFELGRPEIVQDLFKAIFIL
jgi:uncharacterized coiled-coil protein SlyX